MKAATQDLVLGLVLWHVVEDISYLYIVDVISVFLYEYLTLHAASVL